MIDDACYCCNGAGGHQDPRWWMFWHSVRCDDCHGTGWYHEPLERWRGLRVTGECSRCTAVRGRTFHDCGAPR